LKANCFAINNINLKIENSQEFCKKSSKKETIISENGGILSQDIKLSIISEEQCENVTKMYNICIDADNLLYPKDNYERCFSIHNYLYHCREVGHYDDKEKELVNKSFLQYSVLISFFLSYQMSLVRNTSI
jgi:hypothetical protein